MQSNMTSVMSSGAGNKITIDHEGDMFSGMVDPAMAMMIEQMQAQPRAKTNQRKKRNTRPPLHLQKYQHLKTKLQSSYDHQEES